MNPTVGNMSDYIVFIFDCQVSYIHNIVVVTRKGKIKRTPLSAYKNVRKNGLIAVGLDEGDEIAGIRMTSGNSELFIATKNGMAIRIAEQNVRSMSRSAHGVKAIKLRGDDEVVSMARMREGASLLTITDMGYGRRTSLDSYKLQNRGGFGLKNYAVSKKNGNVCGIKVVDETDDAIIISNDGVIIRIRCSDVRLMGRYAAGVKVMRVTDDSRVVSFTRAEHDEDEEIQEVEQPTDAEIEQDRQNAKAEALEAEQKSGEGTENTDDDTE